MIMSTMTMITSRQERIDRMNPSHGYFELVDRFTAHLRCDNGGCEETGTLAGNRLLQRLGYVGDEELTDTGYEVLSIIPSPLPFPIHSQVPAPIGAKAREAAALFWGDHKAAASRVREALEAVLTDQGVATEESDGRRLSLHRRVKLFGKMDGGRWQDQAVMIEAAKWIGNGGTHDTISRDDALDAFELLETVLDDIYVRRRHGVLEKARATNLRNQWPPKGD